MARLPETDRYTDPPRFRITAQGHDFTFLPHGADRLAALLELIDNARTSLCLFYYLFDDDASGTKVRDALVAAAGRGVAVQLIVDDFGNDARRAFFDPLIRAGGGFAIFSARWGTRYLVRNHQKLVIADGGRVMTGGANVSDHYFNPPEANGWCDLAVVIEGPVVERFAAWFALVADWVRSEQSGQGGQLRYLRDMVRQWDGGDGAVQLLVGGPLVRRGHWAWQFRKDLARARRLDTVSAYFSPPRSFRSQIAKVARRGRVRMIMPGKSDIGAAIDVARLLYKKLLAAGVHIFEFGACKLHMKLLVVDDASYVGSANLDKRSFRINVELMVRIRDPQVAEALRGLIDHLETGSTKVTPHWYARRATPLNRLRWRLVYLMSLADYRVSRTVAR
ncbi:phospholipase D-like domain-containing protein [Erythrobacter dokdonensis]|uniref:Phospholipase D n=1 Tax=Erythrobacter dokdonensis DSW-74 TaxID=1300349 RepID=A0A1A7BJ67_9SPHN|nr:phosphatidylserine/phosphatidylglycerophosphate/cardiolipin synthase family protein [Erythrobacter dokdonensis]OBV11240.1 Phospholipase D/Transphosphatidylase [Erythrobacter dokdonensis DSW-74]